MPTGEPSTVARRATSRITATAALLSAPRIPSLAFSQPPSTTTGSIGAACETVSRCAQSKTVRSERGWWGVGGRGGIRASRLPAPAPAGPAASSSSTSSPIARRRAVTSSAIARSSPNGLEIRQSSANVSLRRARSASLAGRTMWPLAPEAARGLAFLGGAETGRRAGGAGSGILGLLGVRPAALLRAAERRAHELAEQRRRAVRARLELGVVLRVDEERVVVDLDHLDEALVRRGARDDQPGGLEPAAQEVVDLVAVAVALVDHGLAVDLARRGALVELDRVGAQAHRAAHVGDLLLLGQEVDDRE